MADKLTEKQIEARYEARIARGRGARDNPDTLWHREEPMDPETTKGVEKFHKRAKAKEERIGSKNRAEMDANKRQRALRSLVRKASDIQKLNKSDVSRISSFARKAAADYKAPEIKEMAKDVVKATSATRGLLSAVARGAGLIGAAATMNEFRKVHKELKSRPKGRYGSASLMEMLTGKKD